MIKMKCDTEHSVTQLKGPEILKILSLDFKMVFQILILVVHIHCVLGFNSRCRNFESNFSHTVLTYVTC